MKVNAGKCIGCKLCIYTCPEPNAIAMESKEKKATIDPSKCKRCFLCIAICPKDAIDKSAEGE